MPSSPTYLRRGTVGRLAIGMGLVFLHIAGFKYVWYAYLPFAAAALFERLAGGGWPRSKISWLNAGIIFALVAYSVPFAKLMMFPANKLASTALLVMLLATYVGDLAAARDEKAVRQALDVFLGFVALLGLWAALYYFRTRGLARVEVDAGGNLIREKYGGEAELFTEFAYLPYMTVNNPIVDSVKFTAAGIAFWCSYQCGWSRFWRATLFLSGTVAFACAVMMATRQAFVGGVAGAMVLLGLAALRKNRLPRRTVGINLPLGVAVFGAVIGIMYAVPTLRELMQATWERFTEGGDSGRSLIMQDAWYSICENPWGLGRFCMTTALSAHNGVLDIGLDFGFPGVVFGTWLYLASAWRTFTLWRVRLLLGEAIMLYAVLAALAWANLGVMLVDNAGLERLFFPMLFITLGLPGGGRLFRVRRA